MTREEVGLGRSNLLASEQVRRGINDFIESQVALYLRTLGAQNRENPSSFRRGVNISSDLNVFIKVDGSSSNFVTPATTATHKLMCLVKGVEEQGGGFGIYLPAVQFGADEVGPLHPDKVVIDKLENAIAVLPDEPNLGIVTVADLAAIFFLLGNPTKDLTKPEREMPEIYLSKLFGSAKNDKKWMPAQERLDAASAWGQKIKDNRGRERDVWRKLVMNARMYIDFNPALVQLLADPEVATAFHKFFRYQRKEIDHNNKELLGRIPNDKRGGIFGPDMAKVADALPKEYFYWFLTILFEMAEKGDKELIVGSKKHSQSILEINPERKALIRDAELLLHFPEAASCGLPSTELLITGNSYTNIPWREVIDATMGHIYNFPPYLVKAAIDYFAGGELVNSKGKKMGPRRGQGINRNIPIISFKPRS